MRGWIALLALCSATFSWVAQAADDPPPTGEAAEAQPVRVFDGFDDGPTLKWEIRNPDTEYFGYDKRAGTLTIVTQKGGLYQTADNYKNLFLLPNPIPEGLDFEVTTCLVDFKPTARWHQAGFVCLDDEDNYVKFVCEYNDSAPKRKLTLIRETRGKAAPHVYFTSVPQVERLWLRLTKRGNRYAYSSSVDGKSFRAHGELPWGNGAPKWIGLIAKNSNNDEVTTVDASFDFFELRQRLPDERPVYLYVMPSGGVDELLGFIEDLRAFSPGNPEEAILHDRRALPLLKSAAQRILQQEGDPKSKAYQTALLVLLEDRARMLPRAVLDQQQQTVDLVKIYLTARMQEVGAAFEAQDVALALSVGDALERAGSLELAAEAYRSFAELIGKAEDEKLAESLTMLKGAVRRLGLVGENFESEVAKTARAGFDWVDYRGKAVLVLFISCQSDASPYALSRAKMMHKLYRDRGFDVLCVCIDRNRQAARERLEDESLPWSTLHSERPGSRHPLATHLGVSNAPMMMLVDKKGNVVSTRIDDNELDWALEELLGPPYDPKGKLTFVDLPSKANQKLSEKLHNTAENDLKELPQGEQSFVGVPFQISDALVQLAGEDLQGRPDKIEGIPVAATFEKLYLLHGTGWKVEDGTLIGQYRVNYEGGAVEIVPVVYGQDVRNWQTNSDPNPTARSMIAWTGQNAFTRRYNATVRLYLGVWENPRPSEQVTSIGFVSMNTMAAPFCVAMTLEHSGEKTPGPQ